MFEVGQMKNCCAVESEWTTTVVEQRFFWKSEFWSFTSLHRKRVWGLHHPCLLQMKMMTLERKKIIHIMFALFPIIIFTAELVLYFLAHRKKCCLWSFFGCLQELIFLWSLLSNHWLAQTYFSPIYFFYFKWRRVRPVNVSQQRVNS